MHASIGDHVFVVHSPNLHDWSPNHSSISYLFLNLVGACNLVTHESLVGVHSSIGDHVFLVRSPNLHDFSPNRSAISYIVNPSWSMQIGVNESLIGACKYW